MIEKAVKSCLETEKQLKDQMATLKKNRDNIRKAIPHSARISVF